jgi:DNA-binding NarL/FixJ family response regulator
MHDLARELQAQLDSKIAILEHLIQDAKREADRLEAAIDRAGACARAPTFDSSQAESGRQISMRVDAADARPASSASRRHAEIYSLADQGLTSASIANRLGSPIGEVELILGLRGKV